MFFRILQGHTTDLPILCHSYSHFFMMRDAKKRTAASCNTDVGDVRAAELEELVDKPGTTIGS